MREISLGVSSQLVASSLLRVEWQWKSAGVLNGRRWKRLEWLRSARSGYIGHTRTTHCSGARVSISLIENLCGLGVVSAPAEFGRSADARFSFKLCGEAAHASLECFSIKGL